MFPFAYEWSQVKSRVNVANIAANNVSYRSLVRFSQFFGTRLALLDDFGMKFDFGQNVGNTRWTPLLL